MGITLTGEILFDLPIYRLSEKQYNKKFKEHYKKKKIKNSDSEYEQKINQNLKQTYGDDWKYNEIIGYLEFYKFLNDIKCAYYKVPTQRITKTRKKKFIKIEDTLYKVRIKKSYSNEKLISQIRDIVNYCSSKKEFKNRFIDMKKFYTMMDYIDWKKYLFRTINVCN